MFMALQKNFYQKDTVVVAQALLGTCLVHDSAQGKTVGRIVETEAYLFKDDPACHASRGQTQRNAAMFGPPGHAYIYLIYGMHLCFNVVTAPVGQGEAVLIRALAPVEGIPLMEKRRGTNEIQKLCNGPGKLMQAMGMRLEQNGCELFDGPLTIWPRNSHGGSCKIDVVETPRIGITAGAELPLRFYLKGNRYASRRCRAGESGD